MSKPHPDDAPVGICEACGGICTAVREDLGDYGWSEAGGVRGYREHWFWSSPCCGADVIPAKEPQEGERT